MTLKAVVIATALFVAVLATAVPYLIRMTQAPPDPDIGRIEFAAEAGSAQLRSFYGNRSVLVVGGTRGIGYGTALAVAGAGAARVTIVGRSEASGSKAAGKIRSQLPVGEARQVVEFVRGDIGTVCGALELVDKLASREAVRYDYLVVTAATFPDWDAPTLLNEDGIDKSFAIAVVGRYVLYRSMDKFLASSGSDGGAVRVLNVLASGRNFPTTVQFDRDVVTGKRSVSHLFQAMLTFGLGNEIMISRLSRDVPYGMVSTHPGILKTDLHRRQGRLFDALEAVLYAAVGITEEDCGVRQASILASDRLHGVGRLSYVDDGGVGRLKSAQLQRLIDENGEWLWTFLSDLVERRSAAACPLSAIDDSNTEEVVSSPS